MARKPPSRPKKAGSTSTTRQSAALDRIGGAIFETVNEGIWVLDNTAKITLVNPRMGEMLGYPQDEMLGKYKWDFLYPEDVVATQAIFERRKRGISEKVDIRFRKNDGNPLWAMMSARPIFTEQKEFAGALDIISDVTDRKRAEEGLRDSEARFRAIFSQLVIGVAEMDLTGHYIIVNDKYCEITGYPREELTRKDMFDITHPDDLKENRAGFQRVAKDGGVFEVEKRFIRKDGSEAWVRKSVSAVRDSSERIARTLSVIIDDTDRKKADEALRASLREKEALLQEIHHRVKNNLQIVTSLLNLQSSRLENPELRAILKDSEDRIQAMALVHQQLYVGGDQMTSIQFNDYVNALTQALIKPYLLHGRNIRAVVDSHLLLPITTAVPLGLITNELVSNAVKYAFEGRNEGEIRVRVEPVDGAGRRLIVSDNGIGLPEDFESKRSHTLGLRLVYLLAEQIEGNIQYSTSPAGTEFCVTFPTPLIGESLISA